MDAFGVFVVKHRKAILVWTLILTLLGIFGVLFVPVTYDLAAFLPEDTMTVRALRLIDEKNSPNMQLMIPRLGIREALAAKEEIKSCPHVSAVLWLDDVIDVRGVPESMIDKETLGAWWREEGALFRVTVDQNAYAWGFDEIRAKFPDSIASGNAANQARIMSVSMQEIGKIIPYVLPVALVILFLATSHWLEPVLFLAAIGVAVCMNEGSNVMLGGISFVTRSSSAVLQLAVSIDYAVFLLHRFSELRRAGMGAEEAMAKAIARSASAIAASAMTTVFGFLALMLMKFKLGWDMGFVLAKGVMISYLSVMLFLPALAVTMIKFIDKTAHRPLMPAFNRFARAVVRFAAPLTAVFLLLLPLAFLGQRHNNFLYGSGGMHAPDSQVRREADEIERLFGRGRQMLLMVKEGAPARAEKLGKELALLPRVTSVTSYSSMVGSGVPDIVVPEKGLQSLRGNGFDRIILAADTDEEGEEAFLLVDRVRALAEKYYGDDWRLAGDSVANYDMKNVITADNVKVLLGGLLSIGLILLITFRSFSVPLVLLLCIEGAIWINLSLPYFMGDKLNYIGYQIVSSVQLGATVDYGILLTQRYLEARAGNDKRKAAGEALRGTAGSILPPAMILTMAGVLLGLVSSNGVISQMGYILGRGAALSAAVVLLVLPHILIWMDGLILKTTRIKTEIKK